MQKSYSRGISLTRNDRLACDESLTTSRLLGMNLSMRRRVPHPGEARVGSASARPISKTETTTNAIRLLRNHIPAPSKRPPHLRIGRSRRSHERTSRALRFPPNPGHQHPIRQRHRRSRKAIRPVRRHHRTHRHAHALSESIPRIKCDLMRNEAEISISRAAH
jgi:hypothetical protein